MSPHLLAVLIGIVEGLTEFLPISSTAHMILLEKALHVPIETDPFWKLFTVVIQLGAIAAVVVFYRKTLVRLIRNLLAQPLRMWTRDPLIRVGLAVVPVAIAGALLKHQIDELLGDIRPIAWTMLVGAVAMHVLTRKRFLNGATLQLETVNTRQALTIGCAQILSLVPGVSRSAATILGGLTCGLSLQAAADFSFLLSIPTMAAATGYSLLKHRAPITGEQWSVLFIGLITSFIVAWIVVGWFLTHIRAKGFRIFIIYRIGLGVSLLTWLFLQR